MSSWRTLPLILRSNVSSNLLLLLPPFLLIASNIQITSRAIISSMAVCVCVCDIAELCYNSNSNPIFWTSGMIQSHLMTDFEFTLIESSYITIQL